MHAENADGSRRRTARARTPTGTVAHRLPVLVVLVVLAVAAAAGAGLVPGVGGPSPGPQHTERLKEPPASGPGLVLQRPRAAPPVLPAAGGSADVSSAALRRVLAPALADRSLGRHVAMEVRRLDGSRPLFRSGDPATVTPASTVKLLTTLAALQTLGPRHRFDTTVVATRRARSLVLVGGGDPLLTGSVSSRDSSAPYPPPASLRTLASRTADALRARGVRSVRLRYDASLFRGPAVNPAWQPTYVEDSVVSPISALWTDEGRRTRGLAIRMPDPAATAAATFGRYLRREGVRVTGAVVAASGSGGREIAVVSSPPLADVVEHVLEVSDNEGAEALLRHVAIATGRPASFRGGAAAVTEVVRGLGVDTAGAQLYDGSGLARGDRVPVTTLVQTLQVAADGDRPHLRPVIASLPVAAFTGSLAYRFADDAPAGAGLVRAKTGTLSGVHGLAGIVVTARGVPLAFAVVADRVRLARTLDARAALDRIAAALATCTC